MQSNTTRFFKPRFAAYLLACFLVHTVQAFEPPPPADPPSPILIGIMVSGAEEIDEESSSLYECIGKYSDGTMQAITATWGVSSAVASIDAYGLLTAGAVSVDEAVEITASSGGYTASKEVTVLYVAPVLNGLTISGPDALDAGDSGQYTCTAEYSDGNTLSVMPSWSVSSSAASIGSDGTLTAAEVLSGEEVVITASYGGYSATHTLMVTSLAPTLLGIEISGARTVGEGQSSTYSCEAIWSDGNITTVVPDVWSENSAYASVTASGVLTATEVDSDRAVVLSATYSGANDVFVLSIENETPVVVTGISITGPGEMDELSTTNFSCTATYSDGSTAVVSPTWSENSSVTAISSSGVLQSGNVDADAAVTVSAGFEAFTASLNVTVRAMVSRVTYPLTGFEGSWVRARLWNDLTEEFSSLGDMESPDELVIEGLDSNQWYWIVVEEYDSAAGEWVRVQASWMRM
jgi:hypothetical protein